MAGSLCNKCKTQVRMVLTGKTLVAACACIAVTADGNILYAPEGKHFGEIIRKRDLKPGEEFMSLSSPTLPTTTTCDAIDAELDDEETEVNVAEPHTTSDTVFAVTIILLVLLISSGGIYYILTH